MTRTNFSNAVPDAVSSVQIKGLDVSSFQMTIDWQALKNAGIVFAFVKATEGLTIKDPTFSANMEGARAVGILVGPYHLFHPKDDFDRQVEFFLSTVGAMPAGDLPPVLDVELPEEWMIFSVTERVSFVQGWLESVQRKTGLNPIIYLSSSFAGDVLDNADFLRDYPLWVADYTSASSPEVPVVFPRWTFWQYSETGRVDGITDDVDLDLFNGTVQQLVKFLKPLPVAKELTAVWLWRRFRALLARR
jgi:lysozyme